MHIEVGLLARSDKAKQKAPEGASNGVSEVFCPVRSHNAEVAGPFQKISPAEAGATGRHLAAPIAPQE